MSDNDPELVRLVEARVFVFDFEGKRYSIFFHDFTVRFGKEEDVFEVSSG